MYNVKVSFLFWKRRNALHHIHCTCDQRSALVCLIHNKSTQLSFPRSIGFQKSTVKKHRKYFTFLMQSSKNYLVVWEHEEFMCFHHPMLYSQTPVKQPPIEQPPLKQPVINVTKILYKTPINQPPNY